MADKTVPGAVELLKEDHEKVKGLFSRFQSANESEKEDIADEVDLELRVHSMIEEEILYPAMQEVDGEIVAESFEEHGVVEELLDELATMELSNDQFQAKFKVMQENVEHHIEEEETEMFPKAGQIPNYGEIGLKLLERKLELMEELKGSDPEERTEGSTPATSRASEKSEAMSGSPSQPPAKSGSSSKAKRAARSAKAAGRGARSKQKARN